MECFPDVWPADLLPFVAQTWGELRAVEPLAGLSGAGVWRLATDQQWAVLKQSTPNEASFYQTAAPLLRAAGVGIPALWWSGRQATTHWLLIEYLPAAPLRATWLGNGAWMYTLAGLHRLPLAIFAGMSAPYRPSWSNQMVEAALELVPQQQRRGLRTDLATIVDAAEQLQAASGPISGDPNPRNWGLRADGSAVLFDWERAGVGPRAFDLAITIPGLASDAAAQQVAHSYLVAADGKPPASTAIDALAHDIACCKVWVVAEFMATVVEQGLVLDAAYAALWRAVPAWVAHIAQAKA
jgi:fructosamine-3-kinase